MKRILMLVGVVSLFATFASGALAGPGKGQLTRQLTGKVTSVTARSITVQSPTTSLKCAARAGLRLGAVAGKRATMTCRMAEGRLVVASVKVIPGKAVRKQSPSSQAPGSSSSNKGRSGPSPTADDPGDDDDDVADDADADDDDDVADADDDNADADGDNADDDGDNADDDGDNADDDGDNADDDGDDADDDGDDADDEGDDADDDDDDD